MEILQEAIRLFPVVAQEVEPAIRAIIVGGISIGSLAFIVYTIKETPW